MLLLAVALTRPVIPVPPQAILDAWLPAVSVWTGIPLGGLAGAADLWSPTSEL